MQAASPEDPAVSQVLARAGAGNECLIMEITPGSEFHHVARLALLQCAVSCWHAPFRRLAASTTGGVMPLEGHRHDG